MSLNILLSGANGYMGKVISSLAAKNPEIEIVAGFDIVCEQYSSFPIYNDLNNKNIDADVIIDFSHPSAFDVISKYAKTSKTPIVFATTGFSEDQKQKMIELSKHVPVFFSANMSLGVNLVIDLVKRMTKNSSDKFDIEIVEKHHNRKVDSPSGTAIAIAEEINSALPEKYSFVFERESRHRSRSKNEIGISSIRGGTIVGEHTIIFAGHDEVIEIKHTAMSRDIFATGSINAAKFLSNKEAGSYTMQDLFKGE